jgi:hypothetical protein
VSVCESERVRKREWERERGRERGRGREIDREGGREKVSVCERGLMPPFVIWLGIGKIKLASEKKLRFVILLNSNEMFNFYGIKQFRSWLYFSIKRKTQKYSKKY